MPAPLSKSSASTLSSKSKPRYFFHIRIGNELMRDTRGVEIANSQRVRQECSRILQSVLAEPEFRRQRSADRSFHVTDASGRQVLVLPFA
jgi:hypothetical protein